MTKSVPHMGKIGDAKLDQCPALDECFPGLEPLEYNLIVAPAVIEEKTQGGLILPEIARERIDLAMQIGRVVAVSPIAFNYDKWPDNTHPPEPGDIVWFARYAGGEFIGMDGRTYRLIKDKDVGARVPAAPAAFISADASDGGFQKAFPDAAGTVPGGEFISMDGRRLAVR